MKLEVTKVWERKELSGPKGKFYVQNLYAKDEAGNQVTVSANNLDDLSNLSGKKIVLQGTFSTGEYNGKPQFKITKKTVVKVEDSPVAQMVKAEIARATEASSRLQEAKPEVVQKADTAVWAELFHELVKLGVPVEQAGPGASTLFIQRNRK